MKTNRGASVGMLCLYVYVAIIAVFMAIWYSFPKNEQKATFSTVYIGNGLCRTTVYPDGNSWETQKDSVSIYIENY